MLDSIYNAKILEFAAHIKRIGKLDNPDSTAKSHSKLCGSIVEVDLSMNGFVVDDFAQRVRACVLGQAAASIMAHSVIGSTADELKALHQTMNQMLKNSGPPPQGKFSDFHYLEPVRDFKERHASTLLVFDAVVSAIEQIQGKYN